MTIWDQDGIDRFFGCRGIAEYNKSSYAGFRGIVGRHHQVKGMTMNRRPASASSFLAVLTPPAVLLAPLLLFLLVSGCNTDDPAVPVDPPSAGSAPILGLEPEFTQGLSNTISWTLDDDGIKAARELEYLVQRSGDPQFADEVVESGWISESSFEFTGLEHGLTNHFRVRGRTLQGTETEWSSSQSSTQDAVAPVAELTDMKTEQTSLLFWFQLSAADEISGVAEIEVWLGLEGAEPALFGSFPPGEVTFQATQSGIHEFTAIAVDAVGNRQDMGAATVVVTTVPEPIIIIDRDNWEFDITAAVLEYRMAVQYWEFGLGRFTIRPVVDPLMIGPGHRDYPDSTNTSEILGVAYGDDVRAYKIGDMFDKEVVDDVVNGTPIAVSF